MVTLSRYHRLPSLFAGQCFLLYHCYTAPGNNSMSHYGYWIFCGFYGGTACCRLNPTQGVGLEMTSVLSGRPRLLFLSMLADRYHKMAIFVFSYSFYDALHMVQVFCSLYCLDCWRSIASPSILMAMTLRALPVRMYIISLFFRVTSVFNCIWDYQHIYLDVYREGAQHL